MNETVTGYVIKTTEVKDNDVILNVYTKEYGNLSLYARGIKKSTSRNRYACQLFDYSEFMCDLSQMKSMHLMKTATVLTDTKNDAKFRKITLLPNKTAECSKAWCVPAVWW